MICVSASSPATASFSRAGPLSEICRRLRSFSQRRIRAGTLLVRLHGIRKSLCVCLICSLFCFLPLQSLKGTTSMHPLSCFCKFLCVSGGFQRRFSALRALRNPASMCKFSPAPACACAEHRRRLSRRHRRH